MGKGGTTQKNNAYSITSPWLKVKKIEFKFDAVYEQDNPYPIKEREIVVNKKRLQ